MDVPWDIFWDAAAVPRQGRPARRQARRAQHADAARRDAHRGASPTSTPRTRRSSRRRASDLAQLTARSATSRSRSPTTRRCPEAKTWLHQSWSGDLLGARVLLHAEGGQARRPLVLGARRERRRPERLPLHRPHAEEPGARAPLPRTSCSTRRTRTTTSSSFIGYTPPQNGDRRRVADQAGADPREPRAARSSRPDQFAANQELLAADRRRASGSGTTPGRSSRQAEWTSALDLARCSRSRASRGCRSSSSSRSTRWSRRVRQPGHALAAGAVLEPARLERRLRARVAARTSGTAGQFLTVFAAHDRLRRDRDGALARDRLPGRLLRRAPRRPLEGPRAARCSSCRSGSTT